MTQDEHIETLTEFMNWIANQPPKVSKAEVLQKFIEIVIDPMKESGQEPKLGG